MTSRKRESKWFGGRDTSKMSPKIKKLIWEMVWNDIRSLENADFDTMAENLPFTNNTWGISLDLFYGEYLTKDGNISEDDHLNWSTIAHSRSEILKTHIRENWNREVMSRLRSMYDNGQLTPQQFINFNNHYQYVVLQDGRTRGRPSGRIVTLETLAEEKNPDKRGRGRPAGSRNKIINPAQTLDQDKIRRQVQQQQQQQEDEVILSSDQPYESSLSDEQRRKLSSIMEELDIGF